MILREKPDLHRAIPMSVSSQNVSDSVHDQSSLQLRHSLSRGKELSPKQFRERDNL